MDRRTSLKQLIATSGGLLMLPALPSWAMGWSRNTISTEITFVDTIGTNTLAAVADTIIPAGDSIGALSVGVDQYLVKVLDKCYEEDVQKNVGRQLAALDEQAKGQFQQSFADCSQEQRLEMLQSLALSEDEDTSKFFQLIKSETIRGFTTSKEVMVNYRHYKVAPGHFYGCVDVNA